MKSLYRSRKRAVAARLVILVGACLLGPASAQDDVALKSDNDKLSYALGMDLGSQLRKLAVEVDPGVFHQGLADALSGGNTRMTPEEVRLQIGALQAEMRRRQVEARNKAAEEHAKAGEASPAQGPAAGEGKPESEKAQ